MKTVSVIVPCYNEVKTIIQILQHIKKQEVDGFYFQVIVIDDGSSDGTREILDKHPDLYYKLVKMPQNGGKGAAVKAGMESATGEYILFQDADLEYNPDDYAKLVLPIAKLDADIVLGSRMLGGEYTRVVYFWHQAGNWLITNFFNVLNNTTFTDIYTCYVLFRRSLLDPDKIHSKGWEQHAEILGSIVKRAKTMYDVPVTYDGRTYGEGKKIRGHHVIAVLWMILVARFRK